ncbi:MAG: hypothetical protein FWD26_06920 [Treponema sp.]|nr:hypothetical protein [Treponema sp.]
MKNIIKLSGIIILSMLIGFGFVSCGEDDLGLNGEWVIRNGFEIRINGSNGTITKCEDTDPLSLNAIQKGYYGVGALFYRNIKSSGYLTYTGQEAFLSYNSGSPNVATGVTWYNITLTLATDGESVTRRMESGTGAATFYRK